MADDLEISKLVGYVAFAQAHEELSKILGYVVIDQLDLKTSKVITYVVLSPVRQPNISIST